MTKVFISYSRKDKTFAEKLNTALQGLGLDSWIDLIDIPPTADWWDQIQKGIESADAFLFLLSPDSVHSEVCGQEIDHAAKNGKPMIPLVARDVNPKDVHPALTKLNWIFFREQDDFSISLQKLEEAIKTDLRWAESHGWLQVRAIEWEKRKDRSLLLRGNDLRQAEEQFASAAQKDPQPTDLQRQYVLESRRRESRIRNVILSIGVVTIIILAFLSLFAFNQRNLADKNALTAVANQKAAQTAQSDAIHQSETAAANEQEARRQENIARANELAAEGISVRGTDSVLSMLLSVKAFSVSDTPQTRGELLNSVLAIPELGRYITIDGPNAMASQNGDLLVVASEDQTVNIYEIQSGKLVDYMPVNSIVTAVAISSRNIVAYGDEESISLWDANHHQLLGTIPVAIPDKLLFSRDGATLLVVRDDQIMPWAVHGIRPIGQTIDGHVNSIDRIAIAQQGNVIAWSGCTNYDSKSQCLTDDILIWDLAANQAVGKPIEISGEGVADFGFRPDGTSLIYLDRYGNQVSIWNLKLQKRTEQFVLGERNEYSSGAMLSADGKLLALPYCVEEDNHYVFCRRGGVIVWDLDIRKPVREPFI